VGWRTWDNLGLQILTHERMNIDVDEKKQIMNFHSNTIVMFDFFKNNL
jgi:hypothetical protein